MGYIKCKNCKNSQYSTDEDGNKLHWCPIFADSKDMEADRICTSFEPQTNADRIRNMTDEKLAAYLSSTFRIGITPKDMLHWLKSEVKE